MAGEPLAEEERLAPDEAFSILGNETRVEILRALGEAGEPLAFSTLYDRVEAANSAQFNYHLDKAVGHFVERAGEKYRLAPAGERVVEAVLSGAVTDQPETRRTPVDVSCHYCGGSVETAWRAGGLDLYCTECAGRYGGSPRLDETDRSVEGYLGRHPFPPAGVRNRTPSEAVCASWTWGNLEVLALASGLCPRCGATVDRSVSVCDDHESEGVCGTCDGRYAVTATFDCTNCIHSTGGDPIVALAATTELFALLAGNGYNPVDPDSLTRVEAVHGGYEETIHSRDPLRADYTFAVEGDRLTLSVDESLRVIDSHRATADPAPDPDGRESAD
ncbi:MAG: winged helix-turn-helix domain-containing protein [Halobaculum sp.]